MQRRIQKKKKEEKETNLEDVTVEIFDAFNPESEFHSVIRRSTSRLDLV